MQIASRSHADRMQIASERMRAYAIVSPPRPLAGEGAGG